MSRLSRFICALSLLFGFSISAEEINSSRLQPGIWEVEEVLHVPLSGDRAVMWKYRILVDASGRAVGVGENDDQGVSGSESGGAVSMVILDASETVTREGFYIQAYEDGGIFQMRIQGEVSENGRKVVLNSFDSDGMLSSTIYAAWVRNEEISPIHDGQWFVREIVSPDRGGWNITWDFDFSRNSGALVGQGNKIRVNGRSAYPGERKTVSRVSLRSEETDPLSIYGTARETNHVGGVIRAEYEGWMSPTGRWFLVESYENGKLAGLLFGNSIQ